VKEEPYGGVAQGDYDATIRHFREIVVENEGFPLLRELAMAMTLLCYNLMERYDDAIAISAPYLRRYPESDELWRSHILYHLADAYYYLERYGDAERFYRQVKEKFPATELEPFASVSIGWTYLHQGRYDEAHWEFERLMKANPNPTVTVLAIYGQGVGYYNRASYDSARAFFSFDEARYAKEELSCRLASELLADNLYYAGLCYERLGYYGDALDAWKRLVSLYIGSDKAPDAAFRIGDLYFRSEAYESAISYLKVVRDNYPQSPLARNAVLLTAQSYYNLGDDEGAQRLYKEFLAAYPKDSLLVLPAMEASYARLARRAPSPDQMAAVLERFLADIPGSSYLPELLYELGGRYYDQGDYRRGVEAFKKLVLSYPTTQQAPLAQLRMAECYESLKDFEAAARTYKEFIDNFSTHPELPRAFYKLGSAYLLLGNERHNRDYFRRALPLFEQVIERFPSSQFCEPARKQLEYCKRMLK
jgi:outer membrane protein assembly factor BamD (BamD/ComL family)